MTTDYHQLFIDNTLTLAKTMVIKSKTSADLVNSLLTMTYGSSAVNVNDLTSWKYYMNICGIYHSTDTMMQVISLDTLELIDFTKENLVVHSATAEAYQYGSRYYYTLLDKYPNQEQLILGILNPADMTTAVNADDYTILSYPTGLVEAQEITLIEELQQWMYRYAIRWDVQAFGISDSLYPAAQHAIFYLQLVPKIMNLRLKRCKTSEAHSFHIRSYLASHSGLDKYYDYMTLEQALFLYRNINYIERNAGKSDIFTWLVDKILSKRDIPVAEYQARLEGTFDSNYYPNYQFRKIPLNTEYNTPNEDYFSLDQLLAKEAPLAIGNADYIQYDRDVIDSLFKNSVSSSLLTKNLESSMTDYAGDQINPLTDVLFNHWGWLSVNNMYHVAISFKDPVTSNVQTMFSDDAFIYYVYILMMSINADITTIPSFLLKRVQKLQLPTLSNLMSKVDNKLITDSTIPAWILANQPSLKTCYSVHSFYNLGNSIFNAELAQWYLISRTEHHFERAIVDNLCNQLFEDVQVSFADSGTDFESWLKVRSLPTTVYTPVECQELLKNIFEAATGYSVDPTKVIGNIQKAMLSIMTDLSSYSIKFIQEINQNPIRPLNWAAIRVGDIKGSGSGDVLARNDIVITDVNMSSTETALFKVNPKHFVDVKSNHLSLIVKEWDPILNIDISHKPEMIVPVLMGKIDVLPLSENNNNLISDYENFTSLTTDQKYLLLDVYGSQLANTAGTPITQRPISDAIITNNLNSLKYIGLTDPLIDITKK